MRVVIFILSLLLPSSPQQPARDASIEGFVVKTGTGDPVTRARVNLISDGSPLRAAATTDGGGKFTFSQVQPGRYRITVTRDGYVGAEYGQRGPSLPGTPVTIMAGQEVKDLRIEMIPTGAIAGRVHDRYGEPVGNATVQALKYTYQDGRRVLTLVQSTTTNDLGEYRLFWMQPGHYIVSAVPRSGLRAGDTFVTRLDSGPVGAGEMRAISLVQAAPAAARMISETGMRGPDDSETYLPVYFPGTTDVTSAAPIELRAGANYSGVDMIVVDTRAVKVRGTVVSSVPSSSGLSVELIPREGTPGGGMMRRNVPVTESGTFEFTGIVPGAYELVASSGRTFFRIGSGRPFIADGPPPPPPPMMPPQPGASDVRLAGRVSIEVGSADVENVRITMLPGFNVSGRVAIEGRAAAGNEQTLSNIRVLLRPDPLVPQIQPAVTPVSSPGMFTAHGVYPGEYRLAVAGLPRNSYVKSARLGGTDVSDMRVRFEGESAGVLEIVIGTNPGTVDGSVADEKGQAVAGVLAVLVPADARRHRSELYRTGMTDAAGRFRIEGVVPGDYRVFAWENVENGAWFDPEFINRHYERGVTVRVGEGGRETVEVGMVPNN